MKDGERMAAKKKLFHNKSPKRPAVEKQLARAVKNYNARLTAAIKAGRIRADQAPEKAFVKEIKESLQMLDAKTRLKTLKKIIRELESFTVKTQKIVKTEGGVEITQWQYNQAQRLMREAQAEAQKAKKRKAEAERKVKLIEGIPTENAQAWSDQTAVSKPLKARSWEKFKQKFRSLTKQARHAWAIYRENLRYTIEHYCYQPYVRDALSLLELISDDELAEHHATGQNFVYINWWYVDVNRDEALSRYTIDEFRAVLGLRETYSGEGGKEFWENA